MASVPDEKSPMTSPNTRSVSSRSLSGAVIGFTVLVYLLLLPPQLIVEIGSFVLPPYRLFLLLGSLFVLSSIFGGRLKLKLPDALILVISLWIIVALTMTTDAPEVLSGGGAQFIDIALAYFFARTTIRSPKDLRMALILIAPILAIIGLIIAAESVLHTYIVQPIAAAALGVSFYLPMDERLGLMRSPGPFPHPILAGIFFGSFLSIFALSGVKGWPRIAGIIGALCSFFSISSAAMLALIAGSGLLAYNWLSERVTNLTWRMFIIVAGISLFVAEFATNSGAFNLLVRFASLNSASSFNRILIWRYGSASVKNNMLFGVGYGEWVRPFWMKGSVDNYWLLLSIQYGLLPALALLLACILALIALGRSSVRQGPADRRLLRGVAIALAVFALGITSVAVWLSAQVWFFALLGIAVSLGYGNKQPDVTAPSASTPHQKRPIFAARNAHHTRR